MNIKCNFLKIIPTKKWQWLVLVFLFVLLVSIIAFFLLSEDRLGQQTKENSEKFIDISKIDGIREIYTAASNLPLLAKERSGGEVNLPLLTKEGARGEVVNAAILPHHTLVADKLAETWQTLAGSNPAPSVIVIIGAAHENQGGALIQTTANDYQTDFGLVKTSDKIISALVTTGLIKNEPLSFENEHSIGTFIPFIAKAFPNAPIVPIIAKSSAGEKEATALVTALKKDLPANALVIFSLDFSHGLTTAEAFKNDEVVRSLMTLHNYSKIDVLNETFLDSPFVLDTFLLWIKENALDSELVWQSHSGEITGTENDPGTSYMIFLAPAIERDLTLTIVGDVMLSRAVGNKLKTVPLEDVFSQASDVLSGSDLVFANLESVLSTSTVESSKEIRFKADPARIDVLKYLGLTHVSVTNNHIGDYGRAAWEESFGFLKAGGVVPVGGYGNDGAPVFAEVNGRRVVFLAFDTTIWKMEVETLKEIISPLKMQADIILVSFHWGNEYQHSPSNQQIELAHAAIEAGAAVVIGHHPHVLESIEEYKDGLIFYSLGNFIFDQFGFDENESMVVRLTWSGADKTLKLLPMRIDSYFPRLATEEEKTTTLERLAGWSEYDLSKLIEEEN